MKTALLIVAAIGLFIGIGVVAQESSEEMIEVGNTIPAFNLPHASKDAISHDGISSESLKGKRYVIATFPAAWSGGCTKEMCTFRDEFGEFQKLDVTVLPLSGDYVYATYSWAQHHELPFEVMADPTREFGKKLGVLLPESGMFKRAVFVVGPDGKIEYIDYEYSVRDDADFDRLKEFLAKQK